MNHYIYYSYEEKGRGYIGSRSCLCDPKDDNYFGSFKDKTFKPTKKIILAICNSKQERYELEYFYQKMHNVVENPHFANRAFQTTTGFSRLGLANSPESRKKMSESRRNRPSGMKGKKHSEETKKRIANSLRGIPCPDRAVAWTEERKRRHSESLKGKKGVKHKPKTIEIIKQKLSKEITLKNLRTKEVLTFTSQVNAAKFLGTTQGAVALLNSKKNRTLYGWALSDKEGNLLVPEAKLDFKAKPVRLMNVETKEVREFRSVKEAAAALNVWSSTVSKIMRGKKLIGHVKAPEPVSIDS